MTGVARARLVGLAVLIGLLGACTDDSTSQSVEARDASVETTSPGRTLGDVLLADASRAESAAAPGTSVRYVVKGPVIMSKGRAARAWDAVLGGELTFDNGCLLLGGHPVIWTRGTAWSPVRRHLVLPDGTVAKLGAKLTGAGGYVEPGAFGLGQYPPQVTAALRRCGGPSLEVALFNVGTVPEVVPNNAGDGA